MPQCPSSRGLTCSSASGSRSSGLSAGRSGRPTDNSRLASSHPSIPAPPAKAKAHPRAHPWSRGALYARPGRAGRRVAIGSLLSTAPDVVEDRFGAGAHHRGFVRPRLRLSTCLPPWRGPHRWRAVAETAAGGRGTGGAISHPPHAPAPSGYLHADARPGPNADRRLNRRGDSLRGADPHRSRRRSRSRARRAADAARQRERLRGRSGGQRRRRRTALRARPPRQGARARPKHAGRVEP